MMAQVKKTAQELNKAPVEDKFSESDDESEDEFIGPPIPQGKMLYILLKSSIFMKLRNNNLF